MGTTRRRFLQAGAVASVAAVTGFPTLVLGRKSDPASRTSGSGIRVVPFQTEMPVPPVLQPTVLDPAPGSSMAGLGSRAVFHGIAPEFSATDPGHCADWAIAPLTTYAMTMRNAFAEIVQGVETEVFGYEGLAPGPTILGRFREPIVVRHTNQLSYRGQGIEASVHVHGGTNPAHADGFPNFYVLPGKSRDYYYPHVVARVPPGSGCTGDYDVSEVQSTMWYHDHAMDITGFNVSRGLAGFYLLTDDLEQSLIDDHVLPDLYRGGDPAQAFDVPVVIQDQRLDANGQIVYDFLDHNGRIGDIFVVNGKAQPVFHVQRRKYRFRLLNGCNARYLHLRLSGGLRFLVIASDAWMLPSARIADSFTLTMAQRHDVIIDFADAPEEVLLENIMQQTDGRRPDGIDPSRPTPLVRFVVEGGRIANDVTVTEGTPLRPFRPIDASEVVATRHFEFNRSNGAWQMNGRFFSPRRADAVPQVDTVERWIFENGGGGWVHPIHVHLGPHQVQSINGRRPGPLRRNYVDTTDLDGGDAAEIFLRFPTFTGPFVFHCHNLEHEDMRMMGVFDPVAAGQRTALDGVTEVDPAVSGIPAGYLDDPANFDQLQAESLIDAGPLEGRGVGIPPSDFEPAGPEKP